MGPLNSAMGPPQAWEGPSQTLGRALFSKNGPSQTFDGPPGLIRPLSYIIGPPPGLGGAPSFLTCVLSVL